MTTGAVTPEMLHHGALALLGSGLLKPGVDMDNHASELMVACGRLWMAMERHRPANMTREGEFYDLSALGKWKVR